MGALVLLNANEVMKIAQQPSNRSIVAACQQKRVLAISSANDLNLKGERAL